MNKKYILILIALALGAAAFKLWTIYRSNRAVAESIPNPGKKKPKSIKDLSTVSPAAQVRNASKLIGVVIPEPVDDCGSTWEHLVLSEDINATIKELREQKLELKPECFKGEEKHIKINEKSATLASCIQKIAESSEDDDQQKLIPCVEALFVLQSLSADKISEKDMSQISSKALVAKLLPLFMKSFESEKDRDRTEKIVDELIRREPDLYSAHKAKMILNMIQFKDGKSDVEFTSPKFLEALKSCDQFEIQDPGLEEVKIYSTESREMRVQKAHDLISENPNSYVGYYFVAQDEFKKGNREEAIKMLEKAKQLAPDDKRIQETLEKAKTAKSEDSIFSMNFSFKLNF